MQCNSHDRMVVNSRMHTSVACNIVLRKLGHRGAEFRESSGFKKDLDHTGGFLIRLY